MTTAEKTKFYEFALVNDRESSLLSKKMSQYPIIVKRNGEAYMSGVIHVSLNCQMTDIANFPFDVETCGLKWVMVPEFSDITLPNTTNNKHINFSASSVSERIPSTYWKVTNFSFDDTTGQYNIELDRHTQNLVATLVIPFFCFNILVGVVYVLPCTSGERVGYSITLVLSFSVLLMGINSVVPSSPTAKVKIGKV